MATALSEPLFMAQGPDDVYWTSIAGDEVRRANKFDGGTAQFGGGVVVDQPFGIAADDNAVYFANYGSSGTVVRCPFSGCTAQSILFDAGTQASAITINANFLYWLQPFFDEIDRMPATGGSAVAVASPDTANNFSGRAWLASDGTYAYWSEPKNGTIMRQTQSGNPETVAGNIVLPMRIRLDGGNIYYVAGGSGNHDGAVGFISASADAGVPQTFSTTEQNPWDLTVDATYVYWTTEGDFSGATPVGNGAVYRAPKGGGTIEQLAGNLSDTRGIVVDDRAIYFATAAKSNADGTVWRLAK
jgi:hypothetical protein